MGRRWAARLLTAQVNGMVELCWTLAAAYGPGQSCQLLSVAGLVAGDRGGPSKSTAWQGGGSRALRTAEAEAARIEHA